MSVQAITLQSDSIIWAGPATITEKLQHTVVDVTRLTGQPRETFLEELAALVSFIYRGYDHAWLSADLQAQNLAAPGINGINPTLESVGQNVDDDVVARLARRGRGPDDGNRFRVKKEV